MRVVLVALVLAVLTIAIFYLVYWGVEAADCEELLWRENLNATFSDYKYCLSAKSLPVFEDWKAPDIDFVEEPKR
jgi:hypothetical protein